MDAVIRNFEIIGEAANRLPEEFKESFWEIDWHRIRGFRNRIVHNYFDIDYSIVWVIKERFLPQMTAQLQSLSNYLPTAYNIRFLKPKLINKLQLNIIIELQNRNKADYP